MFGIVYYHWCFLLKWEFNEIWSEVQLIYYFKRKSSIISRWGKTAYEKLLCSDFRFTAELPSPEDSSL